jgi:CheY-like chemotaxis protein
MTPSDHDDLFGPPDSHKEPVPSSRPGVLVVDDDAQVLSAVHRVLSIFYDVTVAASALEALDALSPMHAAVILDIRMPTHDGFWACERIREKYPDVPVIFHSAYQDRQVATVEEQHKPFAYLYKDGDLERLITTVAAAVESFRPTLPPAES